MAQVLKGSLALLVVGYILDLSTVMAAGKPESNVESLFTDNEDLYNQYQLLNRVVKRTTKGSCSCTCETKPVTRYTGDHKDSNASGSSGDHTAKILRTGSVNSGSQHPIWSMAGGKDTPEVDGENHMTEGAGEQNVYNGNDYNIEQQHLPAADNRESDSSWGHGSRFPWLHLPNEMCFRKHCSSNLDCCRKFNLCDRSASVCVDCWYGSTCTSEAQCCEKYPYCEMPEGDQTREPTGKCVDRL